MKKLTIVVLAALALALAGCAGQQSSVTSQTAQSSSSQEQSSSQEAAQEQSSDKPMSNLEKGERYKQFRAFRDTDLYNRYEKVNEDYAAEIERCADMKGSISNMEKISNEAATVSYEIELKKDEYPRIEEYLDALVSASAAISVAMTESETMYEAMESGKGDPDTVAKGFKEASGVYQDARDKELALFKEYEELD